jgi:hypothetical protein
LPRVDPLSKLIDAVYLVTTEEFNLIAASKKIESRDKARLRVFRHRHPASEYLIDKDRSAQKINELGMMVRELVSDFQNPEKNINAELFSTPKPSLLWEFYTSARYPALFNEITGRSSLLHINSLKRRKLLGAPGIRFRKDVLQNEIAKGAGSLRFLTRRGIKLIEDLDRVFTLMSYYSASDVRFWTAERRNWPHIISAFSSVPQFPGSKIIRDLEEIDSIIKKGRSTPRVHSHEEIEGNGVFLARTTLLPLERLPLQMKVFTEGSEVFEAVQDKSPSFVSIGLNPYLNDRDLQNRYFPIGLMESTDLQILTRNGTIPKKGSTVNVVGTSSTPEWYRKQVGVLHALGLEPHLVSTAENYNDIGSEISKRSIDLAVLPAPMHFLAELDGYRTAVLTSIGIPSSNGVFLLKKEVARSDPRFAADFVDNCRRFYDEFTGNSQIPSMKFEMFLASANSEVLNTYSRKLLAVSRDNFKKLVEENRYKTKV